MLPPLGLTPTPLLGVDTPTATLTSILLATATLLNSHPNHPPPPHTHNGGSPPDNGECSLLGPFAILVQSALGLLAMSALVFKRWRERPQRPVKIWFFDASKQVVGSVLVHIANLGMSMLSSGQFSFKVEPSVVTRSLEVVARMVDRQGHYRPNPCSFYLLNLAIDVRSHIFQQTRRLLINDVDNNRHPHPHHPSPHSHCSLSSHSSRQPS